MTAKPVRLKTVCRTTASGENDTLVLEPGVNVVVGLKDTGKSGWLQTISYLLGDKDTPEKAMGENLATKFDTATLNMDVGGKEVVVQRRWKEAGAKHKVFVNGEGMSSEDFSAWFLKQLGIPVVYFPKGNPFSGATWPELSWRMLFRHVFREERFWSDLADKQPEKEQHACLLQFLGVADKLYPSELGTQIEQRKQLLTLEARKEQFESVLQQAAKDLIPDPTLSNAPTPDAIEQAAAGLKSDIEDRRRRREEIVSDLLASRPVRESQPADTGLGERRVLLATDRDRDRTRLSDIERRFTELSAYRETVAGELRKMRRVETAGEVFKPLSVTCCPYCDQKVTPGSTPPGQCFVCHQSIPDRGAGTETGAGRRLAFEIEQLEGEGSELEDLLKQLVEERAAVSGRLRRTDEQLAEVEAALRPVRAAVAASMPPEVAALDVDVGRLEERIAQLHRLRAAFEQRDALSRQIDALRTTVQSLSNDVDAKSATIPFEQLSDAVSDGINEYLNALKAGDESRWTHQPVRFEVGERGFKLRVGKVPWTTLGATSIGYVALGYQFALLKLTGQSDYNYPGFALIDFPMTLADKTTISDKENYLIEPFVALAGRNENVQVVVCGRAFKKLKGSRRTELKHVWSQGELPEEMTEVTSNGDETASSPDATDAAKAGGPDATFEGKAGMWYVTLGEAPVDPSRTPDHSCETEKEARDWLADRKGHVWAWPAKTEVVLEEIEPGSNEPPT